MAYCFDRTCEFTGTTKEEVSARIQAIKDGEIGIRVGKYFCRVNPLRVKTYKKETGHEYEAILTAVFNEFAKGGNETDALKNIYKIYDDILDESDTEKISRTINYIMAAIEDDWHDVKLGILPKANTFEDILKRDLEDPLVKMANRKRAISEKGALHQRSLS